MDWRRKKLGRRAEPAPAPVSAPWDFSPRPRDADDEEPNLPSPEGRRVGEALARLADHAEQEQRADFPNMLPRCSDCAFRAGTLPNGCLDTVMDAIKCVAEGRPFWCHKGVVDEAAPKRLCSGAMVLVGRSEAGDVLREATRKWSEREEGPVTLPRIGLIRRG